MRHLEAYIEQLEKDRHPAAALGRFLLSHSNSPEYLVVNLGAFAQVIQQDLDEAATLGARLIRAEFYKRVNPESPA